VHDRQTGVTERVSVGTGGTQSNDSNWGAAMSSNGRFVVFSTVSSNIVPNDTNGAQDIFIHDRITRVTE
jgi:hypothetical protein